MIQDFADVVSRTGALLGDPGNNVFTASYLSPFIDQEYDVMDVELERIGMQYVEGVAVIPLAAGTTDLSPYLVFGQPLATMKYPKQIRWKLTGQPDISYVRSDQVQELDEASVSSVGALQWRFADGAIQVTPSAVPVTVKIFYDQISTQLVDTSGTLIRGTAHILAFRVAEFVCNIRGNTKREAWLHKKSVKSWMDFCVAVSMVKQAQTNVNPPLHPRRRTGSIVASNSGTQYV